MHGALLGTLLAGGAAAQLMTLPLVNNDEIVAAMNPSDPGYKVCGVVGQYVRNCIDEAGGAEALSTATDSALASCACCFQGSAVSTAYSSCSAYLATEATDLASQISAYNYLYSACSTSSNICSGTGGFVAKTESSTLPPPTTTLSSSGPMITGGQQACTSMYGLYTSCVAKSKDFASMLYGDQAPCYCCESRAGSVTWTNRLDKYAKTCENWARTGEPETIYKLASTFATFCEKFSDACAARTSTDSAGASETLTPTEPTEESSSGGDNGGNGGNGGGSQTNKPGASETGSDSAAPSLVHLNSGIYNVLALFVVTAFIVML